MNSLDKYLVNDKLVITDQASDLWRLLKEQEKQALTKKERKYYYASCNKVEKT